MKVEVIKCLSHSVELNFGEISVCITTDEAENLIAQLRAVVPVPSDVEEAAEMAARRAYPYEGGTKGDICEASIPIFCKGFKAGIAWERERLMKEAVEIGVSNVGILQMGSILTDKGIFAGDTIQAIIIKKEK